MLFFFTTRLDRNTVLCLFISLCLHISIFSLFFLDFKHQQMFHHAGNTTNIVAYIYNISPRQKHKIRNENYNVRTAEQLNINQVTKIKAAQFKKQHSNKVMIGLVHGNYSKLLQIIHNKIKAQQRYPETALILNQSGKVTIKFHLFPDGRITQVSVAKSSQVKSIDAAAVQAVENASPIQIARRYLRKPIWLYVNVVYQ